MIREKQPTSDTDPVKPSKSRRLTEEAKNLQFEIAKQMLTLATSGFGLVAALAWNDLIKSAVETYIKPYSPQGSGVLSNLFYAVLITVFAVLVTINLTKIKQRFEPEEEKDTEKK